MHPGHGLHRIGRRGGGLGEKIVVERRWVHPIGDIPLDEAALIEPLAVGYHAFVRSGAKSGDIALIGGAGPSACSPQPSSGQRPHGDHERAQ